MIKKYFKIFALLILGTVVLTGCIFKKKVEFNNESYDLQFSKRSPATGGYVNEYIRANENVNNWTKMVGVYHYPKNSSPTKFAKDLAVMVRVMNKRAGAAVRIDPKDEIGVIDFFTWEEIPGKKPDFCEFNIFKILKDKKGGLIALQYARRYYFKDKSSVKDLQTDLKQKRLDLVKSVIATPMPNLVETDLQ